MDSDLQDEQMRPARVLFVCLGNICRSPTAEGVFRALAGQHEEGRQMEIDSAGTANFHIGKSPDPRAIEAAADRGFDLSSLRARQATEEDFYHFDYVIAMDADNYADLEALRPDDSPANLHLFLEFVGDDLDEVPDPYYGGDEGFEDVLDIIEEASTALLDHIYS